MKSNSSFELYSLDGNFTGINKLTVNSYGYLEHAIYEVDLLDGKLGGTAPLDLIIM